MTPSDPRPDEQDRSAAELEQRFVAMLDEMFGADDPLASGDCTAMLERLYLFLDGELTEERRVLIEQHISGCTTCGEVFDFEAELRMVVRDRVNTHVPETLKLRIVESLRKVVGDDADGNPSNHSG